MLMYSLVPAGRFDAIRPMASFAPDESHFSFLFIKVKIVLRISEIKCKKKERKETLHESTMPETWRSHFKVSFQCNAPRGGGRSFNQLSKMSPAIHSINGKQRKCKFTYADDIAPTKEENIWLPCAAIVPYVVVDVVVFEPGAPCGRETVILNQT